MNQFHSKDKRQQKSYFKEFKDSTGEMAQRLQKLKKHYENDAE